MDIALIVALGAIWASAFQAMKVSVPSFGPVWLVAFRLLIGSLALLPWALYRGFVLPKGWKEWGVVLTLVLINVVIPFYMLSWAAKIIPSGQMALLMGITPLLGLVLSHFTTHDDKFSVRKLIAVIMGFSGVLLIVGLSAFEGIGDHLIAQAVTILSGACYVVSGLLLRRLEKFPPTRLSALVLSLAALIIVPIAAVTQPIPLSGHSQTAIFALIYLGLVPTGFAYILRTHMIRKVGVSVFSHVGNLIPIFGFIFGAVLLSEPISIETIIALTLVISGVMLARSAANHAPKNAIQGDASKPPS